MNAMTGFFTARDLGISRAPTPAQLAWFEKKGIKAPDTVEQASAMMKEIIGREETAPATKAQLGKAYMLGVNLGWSGKELPGAGLREVSTQIYILEAVEAVQRAIADDSKSQDDVDNALKVLMGRCLERYAKPVGEERRRTAQPMPVVDEATY
jgi:hypothetical protein